MQKTEDTITLCGVAYKIFPLNIGQLERLAILLAVAGAKAAPAADDDIGRQRVAEDTARQGFAILRIALETAEPRAEPETIRAFPADIAAAIPKIMALAGLTPEVPPEAAPATAAARRAR